MTNTTSHNLWVETNQQCLVAEFDRIRIRLGADGDRQAAEAAVRRARAALPAPAAIDLLTEIFGLSPFERDLLLLCAGVEMHSELAGQCAAVQGFPQRTYATLGLALASLEDPHWSALRPRGPLRHWRLIEVDDQPGLTQGRLRIDERILHYLAGVNDLDVRLHALLRPGVRSEAMAPSQRRIANAAVIAIRQGPTPPPVILLAGDDLHGQGDIAAQAAYQLGLGLHVVRAEDLPQPLAELNAFSVLWEREAALLGSSLLIECREAKITKPVVRLMDQPGSLIFMAGPGNVSTIRTALRYTVNKPDTVEQKQLWMQALGPVLGHLNGSLDGIAAQFRLSARHIRSAGARLRETLAASNRPDVALWNTVRGLGRSRLDDLAQRIEPAAQWDDLILPAPPKTTLRQLAAHARHRLTVYQAWGFAAKGPRGLGISALFAGESGTGKTMAAEVLANALHLDLYRIDLSSVVSKYIGETEKNLRRVFDAAEESGAILLFDEADALFGKRSEVRDSHDRYANIEVSYLLQRMEAYRGLAILTTNMKAALDTAFQRRLRYVVTFPFPDAAQRKAIWQGIFPAATPTQGIDCTKLARLQVAGGNIRNIALNAAFLAAEARKPVRMAYLLQAARAESGKRDRPLSEAETKGWI